jgi:transposase-like protein
VPAKNPVTDSPAFRRALGTEPDPDTARRFGVSPSTVRAFRQAAGIPAFVAVRRAQVDAAVAAGDRTVSDVAREAGVSRRAVAKRRAALATAGKDVPEASPYDLDTAARREALLAHLAAHPEATVAEAAAATGLSRSRAYAILATLHDLRRSTPR